MLHAFTVRKPSLPGLPTGRAVKSVQLQHKGRIPVWMAYMDSSGATRGRAWGNVPVKTRTAD